MRKKNDFDDLILKVFEKKEVLDFDKLVFINHQYQQTNSYKIKNNYNKYNHNIIRYDKNFQLKKYENKVEKAKMKDEIYFPITWKEQLLGFIRGLEEEGASRSQICREMRVRLGEFLMMKKRMHFNKEVERKAKKRINQVFDDILETNEKKESKNIKEKRTKLLFLNLSFKKSLKNTKLLDSPSTSLNINRNIRCSQENSIQVTYLNQSPPLHFQPIKNFAVEKYSPHIIATKLPQTEKTKKTPVTFPKPTTDENKKVSKLVEKFQKIIEEEIKNENFNRFLKSNLSLRNSKTHQENFSRTRNSNISLRPLKSFKQEQMSFVELQNLKNNLSKKFIPKNEINITNNGTINLHLASPGTFNWERKEKKKESLSKENGFVNLEKDKGRRFGGKKEKRNIEEIIKMFNKLSELEKVDH